MSAISPVSPAAAGRAERASSVATDESCYWDPSDTSRYGASDRDLLSFNEKFCDALNGPFAVCGGDKALRRPDITLAGFGSLRENLPAERRAGCVESDPSPVIDRAINLRDQNDSPIKRAWRLDAEGFTVNNISWHEGVERVTAKAAAELGITVPVKARLQSLRIYRQKATGQDILEWGASRNPLS